MKIKKIILSILIVFFCLIGIEIIVSNNVIEVTNYEVINNKLPQEFNNYKIIQLSDIHSKEFGKENQKLIEKIEKENPDCIVLTGDMVNATDTNFESLYQLVKKLTQKYPVYFIEGNHEQDLKQNVLQELLQKIQKEDVIVLDNEKKEIEKQGSHINIYGLWYNLRYYRDIRNEYQKDYYFSEEKIKELLGEAKNNEFNLLLTHNPMYVDSYTKWGADLTLTGHVHGGMIRLPFVGGIFSPERNFFPLYDAGKYTANEKEMIVSRGIGNGKNGFRFLNNPEVVSITLKNRE